MSVKLDQGQPCEVPCHGGMIASSVNKRRKDAVLPSQKHRELVPVVEGAGIGCELVKLATQGGGRSFPNRFGGKDIPCRKVRTQTVVKEFHLRAGIDAGLWSITRTRAVGRGQFVGERYDGDIGRTVGFRETEKRALLEVH